jgi:hypothetical protein
VGRRRDPERRHLVPFLHPEERLGTEDLGPNRVRRYGDD